VSLQVGDRVQFSAKFLRSTGQYTGPVPFLKGTIEEIQPLGAGKDPLMLATIKWEGDPDEEEPKRVNVKNLKKVGQLEAD
jgi:hypothetical protein